MAESIKDSEWVYHDAFRDDILMVEGEAVAHVYPNQDRGGYNLATRPFGGWFSDNPAQHFEAREQAKGMGNVHGWHYQAQSHKAHEEMAKHFELQGRLSKAWDRSAPGPESETDLEQGENLDQELER